MGFHGHTLLCMPLRNGSYSLCPGCLVMVLVLLPLLFLAIMKGDASSNSKSFNHVSSHKKTKQGTKSFWLSFAA